ncbi:MAG: PD-(D/E)XK nuclease family protein [Thermoplasmata archaeon]|nr:PD-(D/E)XK nuclease family protein [Thermoplasmata archaeon]
MATASGALSYSSVRTYLECPLRWKFLYVDGLSEAPKGYFSFGRTVHTVLEELVRPLVEPAQRIPRPGQAQRTLDRWRAAGEAPSSSRLMSEDELEALYLRSWVSDGYVSTEEEERYRTLGAELLRSYRDLLAKSPPTPVAIEEHLEADWNGIPIHGYVDRIDRTPSGGLEILDYKTSRELRHEDARDSDQLGLYQVLVERNFSAPVEALTLYHLRSFRPLSVPPKPQAQLDALHERVGQARDGMRSQSYEPTPGRQCQRCEFQARCPEFRSVPESERERLERLVDQYRELRTEESRVGGELRRIAEELHHAAEDLGVHRIPGSRETLHRRRESSKEFPLEAFRTVLARHGISERLASAEPAALEGLARDPAIGAEIRKELAETRRRKVRWYWDVESKTGR